MAYQFAGLFSKFWPGGVLESAPGVVWKVIDTPFAGVGVRLAALLGESPPPGEVEALRERYGLGQVKDWLYLSYDCWGGRIDFVYGLGSRGGRRFGPVEDSAMETVEAAYLGLMAEFGVSAADAENFPPFRRGFWGVA